MERGSINYMSGTSKTHEPRVIIIPKPAQAQAESERQRKRKPHIITVLLSLLALIALIHFIAVMHGGTSTVATPTTCQELVRTTDYTQAVHLQPKSQDMGAVQLVNQVAGGQPASLVQVTNTGQKPTLDVYLYGCTMQQHSPRLTTLFSQRGLVEGTATISASNTLLVSELDTTLASQATTLMQPLQQNVYREYSWQNGTFVQVSFPGLYPVTSRSEAEALQQMADNGQTQPWNDPLATAEQMAKDLFKWTATDAQNTVLNNNGVTAQVELIQQNPQIQVTVTLQRLIQHDDKGLWFVTAAQSNGMTLVQPQTSALVTSPTSVQGTGALADGQTSATLFDHTLTPLSLLNNATLNVDSHGTYNGLLFYNNSVQNQPGLLLVQSIPPSGSSEAGQLLLTRVILG
jgi:hypothetical protein